MDQAAADQATEATMLRLSRALDDLAAAPSVQSAGATDRGRRFDRAQSERRKGTPPRSSTGSAAVELQSMANHLTHAIAAGDTALTARMDDLAEHLRRVAHAGGVARGALDELASTVERHQLDSRAALARLDAAIGRIEARAHHARADAHPLERRLATLEAQLDELQTDRDAAVAHAAELAVVVKRQAGQLTRLRAQVKALAQQAEPPPARVTRTATKKTPAPRARRATS